MLLSFYDSKVHIMNHSIDIIRDAIPNDIFSDVELLNCISGSRDRRYGIIKRAIAGGDIIHLRRGRYCFSPKLRKGSLNPFMIAQFLYGPSYISFESALSYHGWIPEAVPIISSASKKRSRMFPTPIGHFGFIHIAASNFLAGVESMGKAENRFLIARPWRAIIDYLHTNKKKWTGIAPLIDSLRIDEARLFETTPYELDEVKSAYRKRSVQKFIDGVRKDLGL